jgi:hypothetical protein
MQVRLSYLVKVRKFLSRDRSDSPPKTQVRLSYLGTDLRSDSKLGTGQTLLQGNMQVRLSYLVKLWKFQSRQRSHSPYKTQARLS